MRRTIFKSFIALLISTAFLHVSPAMAGAWDDVIAAHLAGDDMTAFKLALPLANEGEAQAQGFIGLLYMNGLGVEENWNQAVKWLRLSSEQGDAFAQANLCVALAGWNPDNFDFDEAATWCKLSAAQGNVGGLFNLGRLYALGQGVERNMLEAYVWLSLAELDPKWRSRAAKLKAQALKELSAAEIEEGNRRISAWRTVQGGR